MPRIPAMVPTDDRDLQIMLEAFKLLDLNMAQSFTPVRETAEYRFGTKEII
jgi:hypothetical protein